MLLAPTRSLVVSFAGTFAVVLGFALLTPLTAMSADAAGRRWSWAVSPARWVAWPRAMSSTR